MRLTFATIVLVGLPAVVPAQSPMPTSGGFPALPPIGLPLPSITAPLPSIGLPPLAQPRIGLDQPLPAPGDARSPFGSRRGTRSVPAAIFFFPTYGFGYPPPPPQPAPQQAAPTASVADVPPAPRETAALTGRLRLELQPADALQFFADGYYVGTREDVNGELELEAGAHTIEIRGSGYETLTFDVKITAGRSITYRGALKADPTSAAPEPAAPKPPATPTVFYYIPGCYMGNVPPEQMALPPACDLSRLITRKP